MKFTLVSFKLVHTIIIITISGIASIIIPFIVIIVFSIFAVYLVLLKQRGGGENLTQAGKPKTQSRVCLTFRTSPYPRGLDEGKVITEKQTLLYKSFNNTFRKSGPILLFQELVNLWCVVSSQSNERRNEVSH